MAHLPSILVALVVGAVGTGACGGQTAPTTDSSASPSTACNDLLQIQTGMCNSSFGGSVVAPADQARFLTGCEAQMALPGTGYTPAALEACIAYVESEGCSAFAPVEPCGGYAGTLANGAGCASSAQCQSGLCSAGPFMGGPACGTCLPTPGEGEACGPGDVCGPHLVCAANFGGASICETFSIGNLGDACLGPDGALACAGGLYCDATTSVCAPKLAPGSSCAQTAACPGAQLCVVDGDGGAGTCEDPGPEGAPCGESDQCQAHLLCDPMSQLCAPVPPSVGPGEACGATARCRLGTCPTEGPSPGVCPSIVPDGQPCTADPTTTCDSFAQCVGGTCELTPPSGC